MLIMCLALNIYFEATMNHELDRIAVSHVVITRVNDTSPKWPGDACDVISQPSANPLRPKACAFSWTCDDLSNVVDNMEAFGEMHQLATEIFYGDHHFDPTLGANHYVVCGKERPYHKDMELTVKIGDHCYYIDR